MEAFNQPLKAIENVTPSKATVTPEKNLLYSRYMKKAREAAEAGRPKESLELLKKAASIQETDKVMKRIAKVEAFLAENSDSEEEENGLVHVGKGFHLTKEIYDNLYPYQRESLLWFWRLHRKAKGGILGDDMGLGKTIQVVAFLTGLLDMQQARCVLIVLPVAVIINWEREFEKWAPGINLQCFHGSSKRDKERALMKVQRRGGVLLTSYGLVLTSFQQMIQSDGREFVWDYIILDEGHKIKNPGKTTKAIHSIPARHRFILTGTPIQNNLKEMWALFDFATHGSVLGTIKTFMMEYGNPITRARERDATSSEKLLGNEMAESLRNLIHPYFLRRTKADVLEGKENKNSAESSENEGSNTEDTKTVQGIPRLTRKNDFIIWLYLTETQIQIYKDFTQLDQVKELLMSTRSPLAELTVLKKLCDHPRLLSARACRQLGLETTETIEEDSEGEESSSAVTDAHSTGCNIKDIDDDILMAESGKIQFLLELLHNLTAEGHRTLVFSQSRKMLDIVEKILRNQNFKYMRLDGTVSKLTDREQRIKCFQSNNSYSVFLLTTQVGGVGLTLTGADRVVIIDPSWNPATDNQAVDRAYRIGQTKAVVIYRLITCGTVEEKIYRRQIFKDSITKQATGASKNPYRYFSRQELRELFILDDPSRSTTQEQLQELHSGNRKTDTYLDAHIAFLHSLDSIYGISDHDLMFSQEATKEESTGFESETEDYIQKRVQRAQDLVSAESDLTVQLKEQLVLNTQAPGVHLHPSEVNTDRARLRKEWERVHGEPDNVHILKPGADYEERYLSKKTPEPEIEYDLTTVTSEESGPEEEIIEDMSDTDEKKEQTNTKSEKPAADFSPWVSRQTVSSKPTTPEQDKGSDDVKALGGWEYVLSLEASPFTPSVESKERKLTDSDKVMRDSPYHSGDISPDSTSPRPLLKDEEDEKDKGMGEDKEADLSLLGQSDKEPDERCQEESGVGDDDVPASEEIHSDDNRMALTSPALTAVKKVHEGKGTEDDLETDEEFPALDERTTREEEALDKPAGSDKSSEPEEEADVGQRWHQTDECMDGNDQKQSKEIEGAVSVAVRSTSDDIKEDTQHMSDNSFENETSFPDGADIYSEEELKKDAQGTELANESKSEGGEESEEETIPEATDFEMQCDLGSEDTDSEEILEDTETDEYQTEASLERRSNEKNREDENKLEEEMGGCKQIQSKDDNKMEETEAGSSPPMSSSKPATTDEDEVCRTSLSSKPFNDSVISSRGNLALASTPLKSPDVGERSLNYDDEYSSFTEHRGSLVKPKKRAARMIEDSDDEDVEEKTRNFAAPSCLASDSDQSYQEEEWNTAKKGITTRSLSVAVSDDDSYTKEVETSFQDMVVVSDSEPELDEDNNSGGIVEDSIVQSEDEDVGRENKEKEKQCLFEQKMSRSSDNDLTNNSVEDETNVVGDSYHQNESESYGSEGSAASNTAERQDEEDSEAKEADASSDTSWAGDGERYACSDNLGDADREVYYQCIDKAETYLEQGKKLKALGSFLKALNIDSSSQDLQLQTVTLVREEKSTEEC